MTAVVSHAETAFFSAPFCSAFTVFPLLLLQYFLGLMVGEMMLHLGLSAQQSLILSSLGLSLCFACVGNEGPFVKHQDWRTTEKDPYIYSTFWDQLLLGSRKFRDQVSKVLPGLADTPGVHLQRPLWPVEWICQLSEMSVLSSSLSTSLTIKRAG